MGLFVEYDATRRISRMDIFPKKSRKGKKEKVVPGSGVPTGYIKIDISGQIFHLEEKKLAIYPHTLLGDKIMRKRFLA